MKTRCMDLPQSRGDGKRNEGQCYSKKTYLASASCLTYLLVKRQERVWIVLIERMKRLEVQFG
jgi:hypothetical protein